MEGYNCVVGKKMLKICMGDNYTDATVVFREYVQNAIDAIYEATQKEITTSLDNYVAINIKGSTVEVIDRGIGVPNAKIGPVLVDLGNSTKKTEEMGRYGIGRLSGANWCDKIIFETSYYGENICSVLTFDALKARELVQQDSELDCADVMDVVTELEVKEEKIEEHYFRVRLLNAKQELCDVEKVKEYLSYIAPIPYQDDFYDDCQKKAFENYPNFKELSESEKICKVHLNGIGLVKPYPSRIYLESKEVKITPPSFFKITDEDYGDLAWGWYSINEEAKQMGDVSFKGLRLREKNMAVGSQTYLMDCFKSSTDANYLMGELFIMSPKIKSTGSRDGIIACPEYNELIIRLKKKLKEFSTLYNAASKLGSAGLSKLIEAQNQVAQNAIEIKEAADDATIQAIKSRNKEQRETIQLAKSEIKSKIQLIDSVENSELIKEVLVKHWIKEANKKASEINAKAKPGHKIDPVNIEAVINAALQEPKLPAAEDSSHGGTDTVPTEGGEGAKSQSTKHQREPQETDAFTKLGLSEYRLMKKVYQVINSENRLDEKTKQKIKAKLVKKILAE